MSEPSQDGIRVLPPQQIAANVRRLVEESQNFLAIVSPYFKPWPQMQAEIATAARRGVLVQLVIREDEVSSSTAHLTPCHQAGVRVLSVLKLHAKLYVTERAAILTSMNLVAASAQESWEAGILVDADKAPAVYDRIRQQAEDCIFNGQDVPSTTRASRARKDRETPPPIPVAKGNCVRCSKSIRFAPDKPLCLGCFGKWKKYGNPEYTEKHCHACGKESETSVAKPLCRPCYAAASR